MRRFLASCAVFVVATSAVRVVAPTFGVESLPAAGLAACVVGETPTACGGSGSPAPAACPADSGFTGCVCVGPAATGFGCNDSEMPCCAGLFCEGYIPGGTDTVRYCCAPAGAGCQSDIDCCSLLCQNGVCGGYASGEPCVFSHVCCSGACLGSGACR
jgi:hypothetical protein